MFENIKHGFMNLFELIAKYLLTLKWVDGWGGGGGGGGGGGRRSRFDPPVVFRKMCFSLTGWSPDFFCCF